MMMGDDDDDDGDDDDDDDDDDGIELLILGAQKFLRICCCSPTVGWSKKFLCKRSTGLLAPFWPQLGSQNEGVPSLYRA